MTGLGNAGVCIGAFALLSGVVLIVLAVRKTKQETAQNVTYKVDLPGETKISEMKCRSCGGTLTADNIKIVNGAPMVNCPYCNTALLQHRLSTYRRTKVVTQSTIWRSA
ncbi:MAG: hypothetical protein DCC54_10565 [Anaerolineae bacterium]|nr:MAG: hypothetical protein DCC54_10565 [Anaerolineae bacterium]